MSKALYRKYRSKSLAEVVGQGQVTDILRRSLAQGKVAHAYLLTGPRGVGKTSIARILAHEINKLPYTDETNHLDIIEIDAASNNGVEDIRDLREKVQIAPVSAAKKVYIIDEVHMLSKSAFNALLKTLEEPPEHVVFILATTDVDKLPPTIISRTQQFSFRAISQTDAVNHLRYIADKEKIIINDDALSLIALRGEGSFRDSISLLDQLSSLTDGGEQITAELVEQTLGLAPHTLVDQLLAAYEAKDLKQLIDLLDSSEQRGIQASIITSQLVHTIRSSIASRPQLLPLLDQLLDVSRSAQPSIKLLTILASTAIPKTRTAALAAPTPSLSIPIVELQKQATKKVPSSTNLTAAPVKSEKEPIPIIKKVLSVEPQEFNWQTLLSHLKENHLALYSVVSKCAHEREGQLITLYTLNNFYKKKLDDAKYSAMLAEAMQAIGMEGFDIKTIPTQQPPKDSTAAAVAAIMGGGEEVSVTE